MKEESFKRWLRNIKKHKTNTINTRTSNCKTIEKHYGDLDKLYREDKLKRLEKELDSGDHKIFIDGIHETGTSTYRSALKLYLEFKDNIVLDKIKNDSDIDPDEHDGSYELVREAVESLSKVDKEKLDVNDLDMLYSMAVGSWKMSFSMKKDRIKNSNLPLEEKENMQSILEMVIEKAKNEEYENRKQDKPSIGMFGTGFFTFDKSSNDETAKKFISLLVSIKDLEDEREILDLSEAVFKENLDGIQSGSASMMLHPFKPAVFPILTAIVRENIIVLEGLDLVLNEAGKLNHYIENTRKLKDFRDKECKFENYRVLDLALRDVEKLNNGVKLEKQQIDKAWFVGSVINGKDYTNKFIKEGIWENNDKNRYVEQIKSIEPGDWIVIKSRYNKKNNLPFYLKGKFASAMKIKALGKVKSNPKNGKTLEVNWEKVEGKKEWFFFTIIKNLWKVERIEDDWMYGELLDFVFHSKPQDIERFLQHPYWSDRYSSKSEEIIEIDNVSVDFEKTICFDNLHFTDEDTLRSQISIALKSGKSIILIGPPGTGKSKIASKIVESYGIESKMVTAMSDWSSYDTIGGYKPDKDGKLFFEEGIFLSSFKTQDNQDRNQWLIIDEINRADIDKAFGPFFSALSGDDVELGLRDSEGENIKILLEENLDNEIKDYETARNEYIIPKDWRIIATMNTFDKTSLYEMSYAFMRRFAFIPVAIPSDIDGELVGGFLDSWGIELSKEKHGQIARLWNTINRYRKVGPAIIEDIGKYIENGGDYTSSIIIYILPQLEGMFESDISKFVEDLRDYEFLKSKDRLVESVEDFFNIKNLRLEGK